MNNKKSRPAIVNFAIMTAITTFVWIGFEIYRVFTKEPAPSVPLEIIAELNPELDAAVLTDLTQRVHIEEAQIKETQILDLNTLKPLGTPQASPKPSATSTGKPVEEGTEEATEEGSLAQ